MNSSNPASRSDLKQRIKQLEAELDRVKNTSSLPSPTEVGTLSWDLRTDLIHFDKNAKKLLALDNLDKSVSSEEFFKKITTQERAKIRQKFKEVIDQKSDFNLAYTISPDGRSPIRIKHWGKVICNNKTPVLLTGAIMRVDTTKSDIINSTTNISRFEKIFEKDLAGIFILQGNRFKYVNNRICKITGYSKQQLTGEVFLDDIVHSSDQEIVQKHIQKLLNGDTETIEHSYRVIHKNGETKFVEVRAIRIIYEGTSAIMGSLIDYTPHKRREKRLRETKQKYKVLAEQELYGIYILIGDEIAYANRKAANILGYQPDELIGESLLETNILPDKELFRQNLRKRKENPEASFNFETTAQTASGKIIDIEISSGPIQFKSELAILGVLKDITERKMAHRKLMASESRNRAIINTLPDMLVHLDKNGEYLTVHIPPNFDTTIEEKEVVGKTLHEAVPKDIAKLFIKNIARTFEQEKLRSFEYQIPGNKGIRYREARMTPLDENSVLAIIRDVSERKKAENKLQQNEKRLRMVLDQLPAILWTTDLSLTFTSSRGIGLKTLGLSPGEIVGTSLFEYFETADKSYLPIKKHYEALAGDSVKYKFEWDERIYRTKIDPLHDTDGNIVGTVALATDITDQEKAKVELEQSLNEKEILLAEIHHRVKNNLSLINSIFELQLFQTENNEVSQILKQNINRVMTIAAIHELLYKADNFSMVNLEKYIPMLCNFYNNAEIPAHIFARVSPVKLDITQAIPLGLILNELITNAIKHAGDSESIEVLVTHNKNKICMQVKDSGPGLSSNKAWHEYKTLGMTLIKRLKIQLEAEITYSYKEGAIFTLIFEQRAS